MHQDSEAQETREPLNREVRLSLKTILGAAAFAFITAQSITLQPSTRPRRRDAARGFRRTGLS